MGQNRRRVTSGSIHQQVTARDETSKFSIKSVNIALAKHRIGYFDVFSTFYSAIDIPMADIVSELSEGIAARLCHK